MIDYENYILSSKGGSKEIKKHDYAPLPGSPDAEASKKHWQQSKPHNAGLTA